MGADARAVFDTNVVLSALLFAGPATRRLRTLWAQGECTPLVSRVTAAELVRVLGYPKFRLAPAEQGELLADFLPFAQVVDLPRRLPVVPACRDAHDTPFLHLAAACGASLVTGDRDLLVLAPEAKFPIVEIAAFLARFAPA